MMKKLIAILLLGSLLILSLAGCLLKNPQNENTTPNDNVENTTPNTDVTTPPAGDTPTTPPAGTQEPIVYTATLFAQPKFASAVFSLDFNPTKNNCFYVNGVLYASVGVCDNFSVNFESFDEDEQKAAVLEKIKEAESCFVLEAATEKDYMQKIAIYTIDDTYYFLDNYDGVVMRVWCSEQFSLPEGTTPPSNESVTYTVPLFVQSSALSAVFPLSLKPAENNGFYVYTTLYEYLGVYENTEVAFVRFLSEEATKDEEMAAVLEKIKNAENCYVFEPQKEDMWKISVYDIDGVYYFLDNYGGFVSRIWYSSKDTFER